MTARERQSVDGALMTLHPQYLQGKLARHQYMHRVSDSGEPTNLLHSAVGRIAFPLTRQGQHSQV